MGGGVMRTAAKVAGVGVAKAAFRGAPLAPPVEQSVMKTSRPSSGVVSSPGVKAVAAEVEAPLHTAASWDMDDWEFTDKSELFMEPEEPMPRVVFDAVPDFQEAKAATTEFKEAIDQLYLSSPFKECEISSDGSQVSVQSPHSERETKSCGTELIPTPSVPKHALQAFQYLSASSEAQTVVASLVSDPNVWNAVIQNPVLNDFFQSQKKVTGFEPEKSSVKLEELPDTTEASSPRNGFLHHVNGVLQNIKLAVAEMVSNVSNYFQNLFGFLAPEETGLDDDGKPGTIFKDHITMQRTLIGLAVLVALVVLVKRH